jgi:hypothetical protein
MIKGLLGTIADAVKVDRSGSARTLAEEILKKLPSSDWHLTEEERRFGNVNVVELTGSLKLP